MNKRIVLLLTLSASVGLLFVITIYFLTVSAYSQYRNEPPISSASAEKCTANGLVAHWKFDEAVGGITPDTGSFNNPGRFKYWFRDRFGFYFGEPSVIKAVDGNGLEFRGKQWVSGGNNSCFATEAFTISVWVWQDRDDMEIPTIMAKSSWPFYNGWWLCSTTQGVRDIDVGISWGNGFAHVKSGYQLPLKEWHHIAVSMDNTRHEAQFYIDGKAFGSKHTNVPNWLVNWNHDLFLGEYDGSGRWPWFGKLDDVRFYNKVLSAEEAQAIYSSYSKSDINRVMARRE